MTTTRDVFRALGRPRVLQALLLGFASGLPFLLVGNTLGFWLRSAGWELSSIGFLSWVGLCYSLKFLWAPLVDRIGVPWFGRLGHRRGWLLASQVLVGGGLIAMAAIGPSGGLTAFAAFSLLTAFASATQDIVADAWRIERADSPEEQGLLTAAFQLGYRAALLATDSLILLSAAVIGWATSYAVAGLAMGIGIGATLAAGETSARRSAPPAPPSAATARAAIKGAVDAVVGPFAAFLSQHGSRAVLMLAAISLYRLADFVMGPMTAPFYVDLGLSPTTIGEVRLAVGLAASFVGIALGGVSAVRLGFGRTLIIGAFAGPASNLGFSAMALAGPDVGVFAAAVVIDNVAAGFSGAALVAYMSSLTSLGYTATQYALLSSAYALLGKFLKGFSGGAVQLLAHQHSLLTAYALFFAGTALIGIPAIVLSIALSRSLRMGSVAQTQ